MVSAISLCLLALGLSATSSQLISSDLESPDAPISERRTFKHGKPIKLLPLAKKHKKFGSFAPHIFGKTSYTEVPVIHETPKPIYKFHRYQGIEVKPVSDVIYSTPEPIIETHSVEPPSGDFVPSFTSDHHFSPPISTSVLFYPLNDKPILSAPSLPVYAPLPPPPPKPIYSFVPPPPQPVFSSIPITSISPPAFSSISIPRPAPPVIAPPAPVFTPIPASFPPNPPPPPPQPIFTSIPIKLQTPVLPPLPAAPPAPIFSSIPVKIPAPVLPSVPPSPPSNIFSSVSVKIPAPVLPSAPTPSPAPVFSGISTVSPTPGPAFSSIPVSLPPPQFSAHPSPAPSFSAFPPPAPALPSISISATPEPEFPYPPSGTPIPSYIKDISLGDIEIKDSTLPTIETPKYEEVTPTIVSDDGAKNLQALGVIKNENGFFQKIKGWKADKANAALSHFTHFKQKPVIQPSISIPHSPNKIPVEIPTQVPVYPSLQFPGPVHPLPLAPAPVFFPPAQFFPPAKYENFPPNNIESPPLLNSYGAPISHDSYASAHASHDRLSSAASEEELAVVPAPSTEKKAQNFEIEQRPAQPQQEFQSQNLQSQFQQQGISHEHPVYVPQTNPTVKEDNKPAEDVQPEVDDYKSQKESNSEEVINYPNHKE